VLIISFDKVAEYVEINLGSGPMTIEDKYMVSVFFNIVEAVILLVTATGACYMYGNMRKMKGM